ncbi:hypothetical protein [Blautia sp. MSJ-19]|nr:hypothetical protein [Blautia sp. MSJ-19]
MTEERKTLLSEITENLQHLDQKSLELMRTGVKLLISRDAIENMEKKAG